METSKTAGIEFVETAVMLARFVCYSEIFNRECNIWIFFSHQRGIIFSWTYARHPHGRHSVTSLRARNFSFRLSMRRVIINIQNAR